MKKEQTKVQRFTAYRTQLSTRGTHTELQRNADDEPQFEGAIWTDGTVTIRWRTSAKSTSVFSSLEDLLNIHGHPEYGTVIVWHDGDEPAIWTEKVKANKEKNTAMLSNGLPKITLNETLELNDEVKIDATSFDNGTHFNGFKGTIQKIRTEEDVGWSNSDTLVFGVRIHDYTGRELYWFGKNELKKL